MPQSQGPSRPQERPAAMVTSMPDNAMDDMRGSVGIEEAKLSCGNPGHGDHRGPAAGNGRSVQASGVPANVTMESRTQFLQSSWAQNGALSASAARITSSGVAPALSPAYM
jgi:hypothetical protein